MTPEEQRALAWQAQQRKREADERSRQAKLRAPSEPAVTTKKNWEPLRRNQ